MALEINIRELRCYLGIRPDDISNDDRLETLIAAGLATLRVLTGRNLDYGQYRDTIERPSRSLFLREFPIASITSINLGSSVLTTDYTLFKDTGRVWMRGFGHYEYQRYDGYYGCAENSYITVDYIGGYTELPPDLKLALFNAIQSVNTVQSQLSSSGGIAKRLTVNDVGSVEYALPSDVTTGSTGGYINAMLADLLAPHVPAIMGAPLVRETEWLGEAP